MILGLITFQSYFSNIKHLDPLGLPEEEYS